MPEAEDLRRILVALDASPRAAGVLEAAAALARRTGARLVLFRAVGVPPEVPPAALVMSPDGVVALLGESARRDLEVLARTLPTELVESTLVGIGSPWQAVCVAAREQNADLIVIGSHGYGTLDRVLGTTAGKIVNHADRSVLVVRPRARPT